MIIIIGSLSWVFMAQTFTGLFRTDSNLVHTWPDDDDDVPLVSTHKTLITDSDGIQ